MCKAHAYSRHLLQTAGFADLKYFNEVKDAHAFHVFNELSGDFDFADPYALLNHRESEVAQCASEPVAFSSLALRYIKCDNGKLLRGIGSIQCFWHALLLSYAKSIKFLLARSSERKKFHFLLFSFYQQSVALHFVDKTVISLSLSRL